MINHATLENLRRKSAFVDVVQLDELGRPLPSWIDVNLTELCNRSAGARNACTFCPRIDPTFYPNQALHMPIELVRRTANELVELAYTGSVVLCGFGEPMLHPDFMQVVADLAGANWRLELVTNGDRLTPANARAMFMMGLDCIVVSCYDGPHQLLKFKAMFDDAGGVEGETYILRDRWHTEADAFGLKLTNRAGTVTVGDQDPVLPGRPCNYLAYQLTVNWNGDVLLCVQDWHRKVIFGNLHSQTIGEVWNAPALHKRRMQLLRGDRTAAPCVGCNTDGCLHGFNHAPEWKR